MYVPEFRRSFSQAFDAYAEIRHRIDERIDELVFPDIQARYHDVCPCCTFKQTNSEDFRFSMLCCIDGNESLKRHTRVRQRVDEFGVVSEHNTERHDGRSRASFLFIEADEVNQFADEVRRRKPTLSQRDVAKGASQRRMTSKVRY